MNSNQLLSLAPADILVIGAYFAMVLGIGFYLKRFTTTGEDFFLAGRDILRYFRALTFADVNCYDKRDFTVFVKTEEKKDIFDIVGNAADRRT